MCWILFQTKKIFDFSHAYGLHTERLRTGSEYLLRLGVFSYHYYNGISERGASFASRPNYFAVWLWKRLMGTIVYDCENPLTEATTAHLLKQTQQEDNIELAPGSCTFFVL